MRPDLPPAAEELSEWRDEFARPENAAARYMMLRATQGPGRTPGLLHQFQAPTIVRFSGTPRADGGAELSADEAYARVDRLAGPLYICITFVGYEDGPDYIEYILDMNMGGRLKRVILDTLLSPPGTHWWREWPQEYRGPYTIANVFLRQNDA